MKTQEALLETLDAISVGVHPTMAVMALVAEGFTQEKAITIVRWCLLRLQNTSQKNEDKTESQSL